MAAGEETPEAKLQKLHFARQNGTETYTPRVVADDDVLDESKAMR
jgi:hypothetical protein